MQELSLHHTFGMPVSRLYHCFCKTELLVQWFAGAHMRLKKIVMHLEKGAEFEMEFESQDGETVEYYSGQIAELFPNEEIIFTLKAGDQTETSVDVRFTEADDHTSELHLTHSGLRSPETLRQTETLWYERFERLSKLPEIKP
ncbi:SRPBCC family protein [Salinimonas chungwhensis]|uniref:SRPBCC family protein n=1 Tax=Salinimonas chungwhensis TaxID=265425 RepID=UPI00039AC1C5|nr:SRPBCC domain-containing protein [Salinimonas chungwhensis]